MDTNRPPATFGELLRHRRERLGQTQQCLADHATLSVRAIRDMEAGRVLRPRQETVRLLADALRLDGRGREAFEAAARRQPLRQEPTPPVPPRGVLLGRDAETEVLCEAFTTQGGRLVSVVGLGGVGKSRLAQEVAWRLHRTERWSVRWASAEGRREAGGLDAWAHAHAWDLGDRPTLLVLDGAGPGTDGPDVPGGLDGLFRRHARLRVLVTSRLPLRLPGEHMIPLAPLDVPALGAEHDPAALGRYAVVALLVTRMRELRPTFRLTAAEAPAIAELCRCLDGLPRALELAARWTLVQSPAQLVTRLANRPGCLASPLLSHGSGESLHDTLYSALTALPPRRRTLLGLLATAPGTLGLDEVVPLSGRPVEECLAVLHDLTTHGLIRSLATPGGVRYRVLNLLRPLFRDETPRPVQTATVRRHEPRHPAAVPGRRPADAVPAALRTAPPVHPAPSGTAAGAASAVSAGAPAILPS
ncbi:helix-turn-helix domain-containing protein [Streptomyces sp. TRM43335]|uniref:Helix-turn-helix domain-containing protein n=1 Tax=Streptomyces taklimakanensis TaxID=2569853 RepID=A0A6G2BJE0_9ACTN|nr:helix-turn-helix domain-containing protein [Streptomyces taklimakanensis]MTE22401.1 helix-turn-helix domain-containing protein [Streptomyces taklimakanensis]